MITYRQMDFSCLAEYGQIPMTLTVAEILRVQRESAGLAGLRHSFTPVSVEPYVVDFDRGRSVKRWTEQFDTSRWGVFMAFGDGVPVGGAVVAARTPELRLLDGRDDLALLWDLRVREGWRQQGIGRELLGLAKGWARQQGYVLLKIECQNTNVPACRFYERQGAELEVVNRHAYGTQEVMLLWYLSL